MILLSDARRVRCKALIVKDHISQSVVDYGTLHFMGWLDNSRHCVALPFNYWTLRQWQNASAALGLKTTTYTRDLLSCSF